MVYEDKVSKTLKELEDMGYGKLPVCMAKTQMSLSDDASVKGRPTNFKITVREVRLCRSRVHSCHLRSDNDHARASQSPGSGKIDVDSQGRITGLF